MSRSDRADRCPGPRRSGRLLVAMPEPASELTHVPQGRRILSANCRSAYTSILLAAITRKTSTAKKTATVIAESRRRVIRRPGSTLCSGIGHDGSTVPGRSCSPLGQQQTSGCSASACPVCMRLLRLVSWRAAASRHHKTLRLKGEAPLVAQGNAAGTGAAKMSPGPRPRRRWRDSGPDR